MKQTASKFYFSLNEIAPQENNAAGNLTYVTSQDVPGFINISFANLELKKQGALQPIWHPNAHKIGYCVQGKVLITMRTPKGVETFTVQSGEIFFIPQGYVHHIENIADQNSIIKFTLNHTDPEVMSLSKAIYSISDPVFNATFNTHSGCVDGLKKSKNNELLMTFSKTKNVTGQAVSPYKFNIASSDRPVLTKGGYLQLGIKKNLPVLDGLGILGFGINPKGVVEPHWHTNAGELVYIVKGTTRITVLSPNGKVEVLEVNGGEGAFAPASHFHNIENIGNNNVEVIAFFSHAEPDYIGIGEVLGAYSNDVLGSIFKVPANYFDPFKKTDMPLVIVPI